jgi:hypothetical protein
MKEYFKPIEFEKPKPVKVEEKPFPSHNELAQVFEKIYSELELVSSGKSTLVSYATDILNHKPVMENYERFKKNPDKDTMNGFLDIVKQDLGMKAFSEFRNLINEEVRKS